MPTRSFRFALPTGEGILDALILPEGLHVQMGSVTYRLQSAVQMQLITGRCAICNLSVATVNGQTCEGCLNVLLRVRNDARRGAHIPRDEIIDAEILRDGEQTPEGQAHLERQRRMVNSIGDSIGNVGRAMQETAEAMGASLLGTKPSEKAAPKPKKKKAETPRVKSRKRLMAEDPFKKK